MHTNRNSHWKHTHTAVLDNRCIPVSVEVEPTRNPRRAFYYEQGEAMPTWIQNLATGAICRLGVQEDPTGETNPHGVIGGPL